VPLCEHATVVESLSGTHGKLRRAGCRIHADEEGRRWLTGLAYETKIEIEVVTTFSSFRSPELSQPI